MSDQHPVCPEHPDRRSAGTCRRCGRFACVECFNPATALCSTCGLRFADPLAVRTEHFSVGRVLAAGWKLLLTAPGMAVGVAVALVLSSSVTSSALLFLPDEVRRSIYKVQPGLLALFNPI